MDALTDNLLGDFPLVLPALEPDETLFSWTARFHHMSARGRAVDTSRLLYGNPLAGLRHSFPYGLEALAERTQGLLGSAPALAETRTLLPFYLPLLSDSRRAKLLDAMRSSRAISISALLGARSDGRVRFPDLKFCPRCCEEDINEKGFTWWRLSQQPQGVLVCPSHGCWLGRAAHFNLRVSRLRFHLPLYRLGVGDDLCGQTVDPSSSLLRLSAFAAAWIHDADLRMLGLRSIRSALRQQFGVSCPGKSPNPRTIGSVATALTALANELPEHKELAFLPRACERAIYQVSKALDDQMPPPGPLWMICLISIGFESWKAFLDGANSEAGR